MTKKFLKIPQKNIKNLKKPNTKIKNLKKQNKKGTMSVIIINVMLKLATLDHLWRHDDVDHMIGNRLLVIFKLDISDPLRIRLFIIK